MSSKDGKNIKLLKNFSLEATFFKEGASINIDFEIFTKLAKISNLDNFYENLKVFRVKCLLKIKKMLNYSKLQSERYEFLKKVTVKEKHLIYNWHLSSWQKSGIWAILIKLSAYLGSSVSRLCKFEITCSFGLRAMHF